LIALVIPSRTFSMCSRPAVHNGPEVVLRRVTEVMKSLGEFENNVRPS